MMPIYHYQNYILSIDRFAFIIVGTEVIASIVYVFVMPHITFSVIVQASKVTIIYGHKQVLKYFHYYKIQQQPKSLKMHLQFYSSNHNFKELQIQHPVISNPLLTNCHHPYRLVNKGLESCLRDHKQLTTRHHSE